MESMYQRKAGTSISESKVRKRRLVVNSAPTERSTVRTASSVCPRSSRATASGAPEIGAVWPEEPDEEDEPCSAADTSRARLSDLTFTVTGEYVIPFQTATR